MNVKAKVYDLKTKKRKISADEYKELLDTAELFIQQLRPLRQDQAALDTAVDILKELRLCAMLNIKVREMTLASLEDLLDDMYVEIYGGE